MQGKKQEKISIRYTRKFSIQRPPLSHWDGTHIMLESNGCIETFFYIHTNIKKKKKTLVSFPSIAPFFLSSILVGEKKIKDVTRCFCRVFTKIRRSGIINLCILILSRIYPSIRTNTPQNLVKQSQRNELSVSKFNSAAE